ncbi:MAG: hypothetical protein RSF77_07185, partial [Oscillospiraceae bacterium]
NRKSPRASFLFGISKNHFYFLARKEKRCFGVASAHTGGCEQHVAVNREKVKVRERFFAALRMTT